MLNFIQASSNIIMVMMEMIMKIILLGMDMTISTFVNIKWIMALSNSTPTTSQNDFERCIIKVYYYKVILHYNSFFIYSKCGMRPGYFMLKSSSSFKLLN